MIDPVLSLKDVHLALDGNAGRVEILHGISLDVAKGASIGLIGPSGSGKSSLLMLMGGLERATGGSVTAAFPKARTEAQIGDLLHDPELRARWQRCALLTGGKVLI